MSSVIDNFKPNQIDNSIGYTDGVPFISSCRPAAEQTKPDLIKGFSFGYMVEHNMLGSSKGINSFDKLCELGINWVCLPIVNFQETYHSTVIRADHYKTPTDQQICDFVNNARCRGIKVCMKPMVNTEDGVWRAKIYFPDCHIGNSNYFWEKWFTSYTYFILHYAEIAEELGCEMFCIGCEMISTEEHSDDWLELIWKVRQLYHGKIIYNTNHDREDAYGWFDSLDYIATSAYYPVGENGLDKDKMIQKWNEVKWRLDAIAALRNKKYIFMEIGCRSAQGSSTEPWDFEKFTNPDMNEQALYYETCLEVFTKSPHFGGVFWWDWPVSLYNKENANTDISYCIYGKPAEEIVKSYYTKSFS